MKKLLLSSVVLLALGTSAMAQKATTKAKSAKLNLVKANGTSSEAAKNAKAKSTAAPVISDAAMTVQSEAARKKATKTSN